AFGDFMLSELTLSADGRLVRLTHATQDFAAGASNAAAAIDGKPETGSSVAGAQGRPHVAVFNLAEPLAAAKSLGLRMVLERYYSYCRRSGRRHSASGSCGTTCPWHPSSPASARRSSS